MKCENCGENEANVKYTQIINGVKKEWNLCKKCSEDLGISNFNMDFDMPMNLSSFFADFLDEVNTGSFLPNAKQVEELKCKECGETFEEFVNTGKFGCGNCYEVFSDKIDTILKNMHNGNRHIGRKGIPSKTHITNAKQEVVENQSQLEKLKQDLKQAIQEERYEDAAKIRDEIKKQEEE